MFVFGFVLFSSFKYVFFSPKFSVLLSIIVPTAKELLKEEKKNSFGNNLAKYIKSLKMFIPFKPRFQLLGVCLEEIILNI